MTAQQQLAHDGATIEAYDAIAAAVSVTEENHLGTLTFVDFFTLCRSEGRWRIANKTFAHTGGEMPAAGQELHR